MADDTQVYALDEGGNKIATLSTAQILEAIQTAIATGEVPEELTAFIDAIKEQNKGKGLKFWLGTQAEFLALENTSDDIIYFINDSTNLLELANALEQLKEQLQSGDFVVKKAEEAENVTTNINGKAISSIFESDGMTVKEATNVKTNINGKAIFSIFENDGVTVKEATNADKVNGKNLYAHSGEVEWSDGSFSTYKAYYYFISTDSEAYTSVSELRDALANTGVLYLPVSGIHYDKKTSSEVIVPYELKREAIAFAIEDTRISLYYFITGEQASSPVNRVDETNGYVSGLNIDTVEKIL